MRRLRIRWAVPLVLAVLLGAACAESDVQYVKNSDGGLYLKVPKEWGVFEMASGEVVPSGMNALFGVAGTWRVGLDGSTNPLRANLETLNPSSPVGIVEIVPVSTYGEEAPTASHSGLRSLLFDGADPLGPEAGEAGVEVIDYAEVELGNGYWGNHLVVNVPSEEGESRTVVQLVYANSSFERLYALRVFCNAACYDANRTTIDDIVSSWTLENP